MLLIGLDPAFSAHDPGPGHPERPARLVAARSGIEAAGIGDALAELDVRPATIEELTRVHAREMIDRIAATAEAGGGVFDADTRASASSWEAARRAAGAGPAAVEALRAGAGDAAFLALRPPGHHARPSTPMGFCLLNSIAVTAAGLVEAGERVAIVDIDAHHGNGTQEIFYDEPSVLYVSLHQWPFYPGTGAYDEIGRGAGRGATCNVPLPAGATGDVYLHAVDSVVAQRLEDFSPAWLLVSLGVDAHRDDPLTDLGLSAADFFGVVERLAAVVPAGRRIAFLEGGYDLDAVRDSLAASLPALVGARRPTDRARGAIPTIGGPGRETVDAIAAFWQGISEMSRDGASDIGGARR